MWGPCRDHAGTTWGSAPYLSPILSWCPVFSLGTQAVSQCPTRPSRHGHRMGQGQAPGAWLRVWGLFARCPPLPLCCTGITSPQDPGRAPEPSPAPCTHVLSAEARFAIITRFALGGSRGSERVRDPPQCSPWHQQPGVPRPHCSPRVQGRGSWARGEPWQTDPAGTDCRGHGPGYIPRVQGGRYLRGHRVVLGVPRGQAVPAPHAARAAPAGKGDRRSTGWQGTHLPQLALGGGSVTGTVSPCWGQGMVLLRCLGPRSMGQGISPLQV